VVEKTGRTFDEYVAAMRAEVPFLDFAPFVSISARTGQRVGHALELAVDVWGERRKRIPTPDLNRVIRAASSRHAPPAGKVGPPKIFYATQVAVAPPTFVFFARHAAQVHFSYRRFLENQIRAEFGFDGTPIRLVFRERASGRMDQNPGRARGGAGAPRARASGAGRPRSQAGPGKAPARKGTSGPKRSTSGRRNPRSG
jgi:GTP-binding protein